MAPHNGKDRKSRYRRADGTAQVKGVAHPRPAAAARHARRQSRRDLINIAGVNRTGGSAALLTRSRASATSCCCSSACTEAKPAAGDAEGPRPAYGICGGIFQPCSKTHKARYQHCAHRCMLQRLLCRVARLLGFRCGDSAEAGRTRAGKHRWSCNSHEQRHRWSCNSHETRGR